MCDEGEWCSCADGQWQQNRDFCERHQILYCRLCDGKCPDCRRSAGEPDDDDDWDDDLDD